MMTVVSPEQIYSYSLQFQQGIRNSLEDVNERVVALIQENDDNSSASYSESCNKLKHICKEYQRFLQWKNNHQTKLPLDFLFLRKIRDQLCEYKLMISSSALELSNPICIFEGEKLRLSFIYESNSVKVALNFRIKDFKRFQNTQMFQHVLFVFKKIHPRCVVSIDGVYAHYDTCVFEEDFLDEQEVMISKTINNLKENCKYYIEQ